jgi:hypothetical protein
MRRILRVCVCALLCLGLLRPAHGLGLLWTRYAGPLPLPDSDPSGAGGEGGGGGYPVEFEPLPRSVCALDEIKIALKAAPAPAPAGGVLVCVQPQGAPFAYLHHAPDAAVTPRRETETLIKCDLNEDACVPRVASLSVKTAPSPSEGGGGAAAVPFALIIRFAGDTSRPALPAADAVLAALRFQPPLTGP